MALDTLTLVSWCRICLQVIGVVVTFLSLISVNALAIEVPGQVETPGQIEKRFEPPVLPKSTTVQPPLEVDIPERLPPADAEKIKFVLEKIVVEGSTVYRENDLLPLYRQFLKKEISLADVYKIADAITIKYRNEGYILSRAFVPPQRISEGVVQLQVLEGYINEVIIDGPVRGRQKLLEAYGDKITRSRPLQAKVLERYLLLADDLPGVTAKSVLNPSGQPGASDLILIIVDHKTLDGNVNVDNRGTSFLGPFEASAGININSIFGLYEQTGMRVILASPTPNDIEELIYLQVTHEEQLGTEGTKFSLFGNVSRSKPGNAPTFRLQELEVVGNNITLSASLSHPFIRSRGQNSSATLRFIYRNSRTDLLGSTQSEDRLRVVNLGLSYDFADRLRGVNLVNMEVSRGLDVLDATPPGPERTRAEGRNDFAKVAGQIFRLQQLAPSWSLLGTVTGQYAFDKVLASEEFSLGGSQFGRAYDPAELTGDHGAALEVELQYGRTVGKRYFKDFQAYIFYDVGTVWRRKTLSETRPPMESLASAGAGARYNLTDTISGYLEVDKPLTREVTARGNSNVRFFFSIGKRF
ncbi:MAG: ShlB/FhaC/HecB family hemolysin secretion/activation protein [Candidatus Tectomicrobia bacterium]|nr:ShlB/FhaC/HecB family hemolysin secretion/activation protein [Candidatus Tectomicrobia bacterium]